MGTMVPVAMMPEIAEAQSVQVNPQTNEIYAGLPFVLSLTASDFDEAPQPEVDEFEILNANNEADADIQLLGVSPQFSSFTSIVNGRMTQKKEVRFSFNFQITPKHEGAYIIPEIRISQGSKSATTQKMTFTAKTVGKTDDMKIELKIPDRKYWVGETIDATLVWYLRKDVGEHSFNIPILQMPEYFDVQEPDNMRNQMRRNGIILNVGSRQVAFDYSQDTAMMNGIQYNRILVPIRITPLKSGVIAIPASSVYAELVTGMKQDFWGFGERTYQRYMAEDKARTCEIMELPQANKPVAFSNAMGSDFSIEVKADRTIVQMGEKIVLTIDISSPDALDGLMLPPLNAAGLNEQLFGVSNEDPVGENIDGGPGHNIRRFSVPVRINSERVTEVPPIAFSFFNPKTGQYSTVRSQPIALSVSAADKIGAADVISAKKLQPSVQTAENMPEMKKPEVVDPAAGMLELSLLSNAQTLDVSHRNSFAAYIRIALYALPFLLWAGLIGVRRLRKSRKTVETQRKACDALKSALSSTNGKNARDAAAEISNALDVFLTETQTSREPFNEVREQMEIEAYNPNSRELSETVKKNLVECLKKNVNPVYAKLVSSIFALLLALVVCGQPEVAQAQDAGSVQMLEKASQTYHDAMNVQERSARTAAFKQAYMMFDSLAKLYPDSPEVQVDAGNAALNAADFGHAVLAYKRALKIDPSLSQAQSNLAYIQSMQGDVEHDSAKIISSVFFLDNVPKETRLLIAAILFAFGMLLVIPWKPEHKRLMRWIAVLPLAIWLWLVIGVYASSEQEDAVVMNEVFLKTADNAGASNASSTALLPGYTVHVIKMNGEWMQVKTLSGIQGWVKSSSVERVKLD